MYTQRASIQIKENRGSDGISSFVLMDCFADTHDKVLQPGRWSESNLYVN